jgi:uncharacterized protein YxeA
MSQKRYTVKVYYNTGKPEEFQYSRQSNAEKYARLYFSMNEVKRVTIRDNVSKKVILNLK